MDLNYSSKTTATTNNDENQEKDINNNDNSIPNNNIDQKNFRKRTDSNRSSERFNPRLQVAFDNDFPQNDTSVVEDLYTQITSVSYNDLHMQTLIQEQLLAVKSLIVPNGRSKLFNCSFRIFKKKDIIPTLGNYKIGQLVDVNMSFIDDSKNFYLQQLSRLDDLKHMEHCIQNYANVLLSDDTLQDELYSFQSNSAKYDVVLCKCSYDNKWRRAIYIDRVTSNSFELEIDDEDEEIDFDQGSRERKKPTKDYYSFFLIDHGNEDLIIRGRNDSKKDLFILPVADKLMQIGAFVLKCSLIESHYKRRQIYCESDENKRIINLNEMYSDLFEKKFRELLKNKKLRMRLSQLVNIKSEIEAMVELFFSKQESLKFKNELMTNSNYSISTTLSSQSKFNCIQYISNHVEQELNLEFELYV